MAFVRGMLGGVQARGDNIAPFLAVAQIPAALLEQASSRVTGEQYVALFHALVDQREDESLGFLSRPLKPGSFALITRSALGAQDLQTAMKRAAKTMQLLQDDLLLELHAEGGRVGLRLRFTNPSVAEPVFLHEMLVRVFWRLLAWFAAGKLRPIRFDFAFEIPAHAGSYGRIFPGLCEFGHQHTTVWFDASWLTHRVHWDEVAVRMFLADAQSNVILSRTRDDAISNRVRDHLRRTQPSWADLGVTASALHMSAATLQRRLALEGVSFQSLKDELRRDIAIVRLNGSSVSLIELAQELGFTDSTAFQRAFKSWTGSAPGAYRKAGG